MGNDDGMRLPEDLRSRLEAYLRLGPDGYRESDPRQMPPAGWPRQILATVRSGYEQLLQGEGLSRDRPLQGIGVTRLNSMMHVLDFTLVFQAAYGPEPDVFLDECHYQHNHDPGRTVILWNRVEYPPMPAGLVEALARMT